MNRFNLTYILPASQYSVNNFTLSYILHTGDFVQYRQLNDIDSLRVSRTINITVIVLGNWVNINYRYLNSDETLAISPHSNTIGRSSSKPFEQTDLNPLTWIAEANRFYLGNQITSIDRLLFIEAEYV